METAGVTPRVAVSAPELTELFRAPGPFVSLYLTTEAAIENAAQLSERRWKPLRAGLVEQGAPSAALDAIDAVVPDAHLHGDGLAVVANESGILHLEHESSAVKTDVARFGALPYVVPLIEWRQRDVPHVMVLADRLGADIVATRRDGPELHRQVEGEEDEPVTKVNAGGWSHRRFQQRAENTWQHNADDVAGEIVRLVDAVGARFVALGGDVRAVQLIKDALPSHLADLVHEIRGTRAAGADPDAVADEITTLIATTAAADTVALLQKFKEELGQRDRAVDGAADTAAALSRAQVDVLLVPADEDEGDGTMWVGADPTQLGRSADDVRHLGDEAPFEAPMVDALVRSAFGTGAGVRVVPRSSAPTGGIGAVLRWAQ